MEKSPRSVDLPKLTVEAAIEPTTIDEEKRTVDVVFYTGASMPRYDWETGQTYLLTLSLEPGDVRMGRLNDGAPFLKNHDTYDLESTIGAIEPGTAKIAKGQARATVRFVLGDKDADAVWNKIRQRIIRNVSMGAWIYRFEQTDANQTTPMKRHATDWEPFEISAVPIGADGGARVLASETTLKKPCVIVTRSAQETVMDKPETTPAAAETVDQNPQQNPGDPGAGAERVQAAAEPQTEHQRGTAHERSRVDAIMRAVLAVNLPIELAQDLINKGMPLVEAQAVVIEQVQARGRDSSGPSRIPSAATTVTRDANAHVRLGITNALLNRMAPQFFKLDETGKLYRGRHLLQLAEFYLQSTGLRTTHLSPLEIASAALGFQVHATGYHTTSDFPNILADVANKTAQAAYEAAPQTFLPLIRRAELRDFKPVRRTRISEFPALQALTEHGEIKAGTMSDAKEQYQLGTFATRFGLSREALINDDTNTFSDLVVAAGQAARDTESDLVWAQLTSNPIMGDGTALFDATHGNVSGGAGAIGVTTIGAGYAAMRKQKNIAGRQFINVAPAHLIVPAALETIALQFVSTALLASAPSNVNPYAGKLAVIVEPRLDAVSASVWYLGASVAQIPIIELGFLAGQTGPMITSRAGWEVEGFELKIVHDVSAKVMDWKGLFRNSS